MLPPSARVVLSLSLLVAAPFAAFARPHRALRAAQSPPRANVTRSPTPRVDEPVWSNTDGAPPTDAATDALDAEAILRAVRLRYAGVIEFEADFERFETDLATQTTTVSRGRVELGQRSRMRWERTDGPRDVLASDGRRVTDYRPSLNRAYVSVVERSALAMAVAFVTESRDLRADFTARVFVATAQQQQQQRRMLVLEPRSTAAPLTTLLLVLDSESDEVVEVAFMDHLHHRERYRFTARQLRKNATLSPSRFALSLPPTTTVIQPIASPNAAPLTSPVAHHTSPQSVRTSSRTQTPRSP
jgi:outer membrane lipoprotein-sorting protein